MWASRSGTACSATGRWPRAWKRSNSIRRALAEDLDRAWEVLGEAVQTVMRAHGIADAYDRLKTFTRGRPVDERAMREFIASLELPAAEKERLLRLEPGPMSGLAPARWRKTLHGAAAVGHPKRDAVSTSLPRPNGTIPQTTRGRAKCRNLP